MKGLNLYFQQDVHQISEVGVSEVRFKKNSTPSPWKHRKTTSSFLQNGRVRVKII